MGYKDSTEGTEVPKQPSEAKALLEAGAGLGKEKTNTRQDGIPYTLVPEGWQLEELPIIDKPNRAKGLAKLRDVPSFVRYFNDHKTSDSRIYAEINGAKFLAVFDDFPSASEELAPAWREFRAEFLVPQSREWATWTNKHKAQFNQVAFAEFIQENAPDVVDPSSAALMEMALNFSATEDGSLVSAVRLQNGDTTFVIKSETKLAENIVFPEFLKLSIPVFENGALYELRARMRYRARDKLVFWYELERPHKVLEQAFKDAWATIAKDTGGVILLGTPE